MPHRDIIVLGGSAGSVEVLARVARGLPTGFPASVFVVCHFPAGAVSVLPDILSRSGPLLARHPADGDPILPGQIYVAPPDHHLTLEAGRVRVTGGARENNHRPAIDPLFRTAARVYGPRVIGVVLSGALYDGVAGLMAVRSAGGVAVVQDPADAFISALPRSAQAVAGADHVVPAAELAALLVGIVRESPDASGGANMADPLERMPEVVEGDMEEQVRGERRGELSTFTCPECGGSLWQVDEPELVRFRCHVGHSYYGEALLAEQSGALEAALWTAVRTFREKAVLARQMALGERQRNRPDAARRFAEQAQQSERYGELIRQNILLDGEPSPAGAGRPTPARGDWTQPAPPPTAADEGA